VKNLLFSVSPALFFFSFVFLAVLASLYFCEWRQNPTAHKVNGKKRGGKAEYGDEMEWLRQLLLLHIEDVLFFFFVLSDFFTLLFLLIRIKGTGTRLRIN
jgi:hypothetical protein